MEAPVIGIDLGTTFSCVAVFKDDKAHVIEVKDKVKTMASVVSYTEDGRIIGNSAKENFSLDPASTVCGVKRFMGQRYKDLKKENLKNYPVEIINENDCPRFKVYFRGDEHCFSPEEVSASILETLKACADEYLDTDVKRVVITVPAHFNEAQRQATIDAGRIAGLEVLRIINEPTAAALAYGIHKHYKSQQNSCNILVYDFGGGTFDVSIINIDDGIFEVKATNGDTQLGGDDIDQLIVDHFVKKFETKYNTSLEFERRAIRRLRVQSEKLKKVLSNKDKASIDIPDLTANFDLDECMTRSEFEAICIPFIEKTLDLVQVALDDAKLKVSEIDEVVLVGGSTKINKVREMLKDFFEGKTLNLSLNPDEAIAIGASIQAAILDKERAYSEVIGSLLLLDVNSLSLGVQTLGRIMSVLIPRNTQIPTENTKTYYTAAPNQTNMSIAVYEGERKKVSENSLLGKFRFDGITPAPTGDIPVYITFNINTDGILKVTAVEKNNNIVKSIDIDMQKNSLSNADIRAMIEKANRFRAADKEWEENTQAKNKLNLYCADILYFKKNLANRMTDEQCSKLTQKCDEVLEWLTNHKNESKNIYEEKRKEVFNICNPIVKLFS